MSADAGTKPRRVTFKSARRLAMTLRGVEDGTSYGTPALKVRGKLLARLRGDGETLVIPVDFPVREALMQEDPGTFFITDHYLSYPSILVRLSTVRSERLRQILTHAWRRVAPKTWVKSLPDEG